MEEIVKVEYKSSYGDRSYETLYRTANGVYYLNSQWNGGREVLTEMAHKVAQEWLKARHLSLDRYM